MLRHTTQSPIDAATLARMDAEFLAGKYNTIDVPVIPPLDPATDPFGMDYQWLQDAGEYEAAFAKMLHTFPTEILRNSARAFRNIPKAETFASGSDEEVFKDWIRARFIPLCRSSQPTLLERLSQASQPSFDITGDVIALLRNESGFDTLSPNDQVLIAYAAIDLAREELKQQA